MGTIATTEKKGLTVAQVGGNEIYKQLHLIQDVISLGKLDGKHSYTSLFAEPQEYEGSIDWYAEGGAVRVMALSPEERQPILRRFREMIETLQNYAASLREQKKNPAYRGHADILEHAVIMPSLDYLYAVDGNPVMVCWGFWEGDNDLVTEARKLIRQIDTTIAEDEAARPALQKDHEGTAEAEAPLADSDISGTAPVAGITAQADTKADLDADSGTLSGQIPGAGISLTAEAPAQNADIDQLAKKSSSQLPLLILGLLLVLLLALAAWYFLKIKPEDSPVFLKGDVNANGVLSNENGETVDLRLHFSGESATGTSSITEKDQTCQGTVTAHPGTDNTILFEMGELICPNQNNYEPFSLVCVRGSKTCTGTSKNGDSYKVDVNMEGELAQ